MTDLIPWPSPRAQWSAFFTVATLIVGPPATTDAVTLAARFATVFLVFYFPVAWLYNYDFSLPSRDTAD
jgi:hypothetical protein